MTDPAQRAESVKMAIAGIAASATKCFICPLPASLHCFLILEDSGYGICEIIMEGGVSTGESATIFVQTLLWLKSSAVSAQIATFLKQK